MSELTKTLTESVTKPKNLKQSAVNVSSAIGGLIAGGVINKGLSSIEKIAPYKVWVDTGILALSAGSQFLPDSKLPSWGKHMTLGLACYSALSILSSIATSSKTPDAVKNILVGYLPTITNGSSLSGMGSIAAMLNETNYTDSAMQIAAPSHVAPASTASTMNGIVGRSMILN